MNVYHSAIFAHQRDAAKMLDKRTQLSIVISAPIFCLITGLIFLFQESHGGGAFLGMMFIIAGVLGASLVWLKREEVTKYTQDNLARLAKALGVDLSILCLLTVENIEARGEVILVRMRLEILEIENESDLVARLRLPPYHKRVLDQALVNDLQERQSAIYDLIHLLQLNNVARPELECWVKSKARQTWLQLNT